MKVELFLQCNALSLPSQRLLLHCPHSIFWMQAFSKPRAFQNLQFRSSLNRNWRSPKRRNLRSSSLPLPTSWLASPSWRRTLTLLVGIYSDRSSMALSTTFSFQKLGSNWWWYIPLIWHIRNKVEPSSTSKRQAMPACFAGSFEQL